METRTEIVSGTTAVQRYCRTLVEVDAIQVLRDNLDDLLKFTGGGTMTTPRTPNGRAIYSFPCGNGIFIDTPETWYIIREPNGRLTARPECEFNREFEPKGAIKDFPAVNIGTTPNDVQRLFTELFGNDLKSRCKKLYEEYTELTEVIPEIFDKNVAQCTDEQLAAIIDELADVHGVLFHIAAILGLTQWELVLLAYDKVKGRQTDPMYKRTHLHKQ